VPFFITPTLATITTVSRPFSSWYADIIIQGATKNGCLLDFFGTLVGWGGVGWGCCDVCAVAFINCGAENPCKRASTLEASKKKYVVAYRLFRRHFQIALVYELMPSKLGFRSSRNRKGTIRTPESIETVRAVLEERSHRSARRNSAVLKTSGRSSWRISHENFNFHPKKPQILQGAVARTRFNQTDFFSPTRILTLLNDDEFRSLFMGD